MFTIKFWRDAVERAASTCAQTFVALYVLGSGGVVPAFGQLTHAAIAAGVAAGLSVVKALAGSQVGDGSPSLLPPSAPKLPPPIDDGQVSWLEVAVVATLVLVVLIFIGVSA